MFRVEVNDNKNNKMCNKRPLLYRTERKKFRIGARRNQKEIETTEKVVSG